MEGIRATGRFRDANLVQFLYPRWPPFQLSWNSSNDISSNVIRFWSLDGWHSSNVGFLQRMYHPETVRSHRSSKVQPFMWRHLPNGMFQHDNARPRWTAYSVSATNSIAVLDLPSLSPDLSPMEQLWDELGCIVYHSQRQWFTSSTYTRMALPSEVLYRVDEKKMYLSCSSLRRTYTLLRFLK